MLDRLDLPELAPYRTLRLQQDHLRAGIFVAEGEKVVRRLLETSLRVRSLLLPAEHVERIQGCLERRTEEVEVYIAPRSLLEQLTGFTIYQGWLACAELPPAVHLSELVSRPGPRFWVAFDGLANAENLGGILRSAAAFGVGAAIVGETCASPYLRRAVRSSMGEVFRLPIIQSECLVQTLEFLRGQGIACIAAHPCEDGLWLSGADLRRDCCIVLGHEGLGISGPVQEVCDVRVSIPMSGGVDSLNVSSAAAVFFYEAWRQRNSGSR